MHTPEPWRIEDRFVVAEVAGGRPSGEVIGEFNPTVLALVHSTPNRENAARAAQCVNACRGIADPEKAVPALVRAAKAAVDDWLNTEPGTYRNVVWLAKIRDALASCEPATVSEGE